MTSPFSYSKKLKSTVNYLFGTQLQETNKVAGLWMECVISTVLYSIFLLRVPSGPSEQARSGTGDEKARSLVLLSSHRQQHEQGTSGDSTRAGDLRAATRAGDQ
ncbi:uncharacterized protein LOC125543897 isoform X4 [Triticum urartu]|uniref:uncharacterized protein LOC125543897 isoform X4 n=1 Tax=Triticum urartu TaxID=4572 RepID=UPI002044817B|nr:uncharacterized protein LOC125543897 isoform X4 [Triticum urartu]